MGPFNGGASSVVLSDVSFHTLGDCVASSIFTSQGSGVSQSVKSSMLCVDFTVLSYWYPARYYLSAWKTYVTQL